MFAEEFRPEMKHAISEVLESMCFLVPEDDLPPQPGAETDWVCRRLDFRGPQNGSFGISVPLATARVAASNFLGEDADQIGDGEAGEIVGEIANMACGTLLSQMNSKQHFALSPPQLDFWRAGDPAAAHRVSQTFALEDGVLVAWLEIEPS